VAELAARQPEHVKSASAYVTGLATEERIAAGRRLAATHAALLDAVEATYGVDRNVLMAIWGIETAFGTEMGGRPVLRSLMTLALLDARRAGFWQRELLVALRLVQDGVVSADRLVGSWAGAFGHTQFIPSTFSRYAVDFDKDGRRDLPGSVADALASAANYLRASGWMPGLPWGFEVALPRDFDFAWSTPGRVRSLSEWRAAGVVAGAQAGLPPSLELQLLLPAGARGPAFLVSANFRAILRYNQANAYALSVGHLADRIAGGAALATPWPDDDKPLNRAERQELQSLLSVWGHDTGGLDGIIGDRTRAAIRATQRSL
jgi:membrane-bound lytic murein transglycosylase B